MYPWTAFSPREPRNHGSGSELPEAATTAAPTFATGWLMWIEYSVSLPFSFICGPVEVGGGPKGLAGNRYSFAHDLPGNVSPLWNFLSGWGPTPSRPGRST